mmetsp:Transcript_12607/g.22889  ORF Transcript_12607/g.22889 Transcript_12607/m.22889 type:complete len:659 (-) Transcript_12607:48-2024(-)|eukprot:CAMPEP_0197520464 /NCGR_PEP_ID=MMETSP1318-20131121/5804_1 /TAXON_ID=552666 /ORGANISM="Partenskyella glossopodia, Strain RCC365" /LENGTH=658 /DNA_ID=CAMNT_0043072047 /DNA_START=52 /DNA_END=2028 /DNA_ORIENTATION=+
MPKLTKKQKAELAAQKAEELRLAKEAEIKRLEDQRVKILALKKVLVEEKATRQAEEAARFKDEAVKQQEVQKEFSAKLLSVEQSIKADNDWESYLDCSELPDPENLSDLNSFVTMQKEEVDPESMDLDHVIRTCHQNERVVDRIQASMGKLMEEANLGPRLHKLKNTSRDLHDISVKMIDRITLTMVRNGEDLTDKNGIFQTDAGIGKIRFGAWIRYPDEKKQKNSDVGDIEFENIGIIISKIPMGLRIERTGIRVMHLNFDCLPPAALKNQAYVPIGGMFYIQRLAIPEEADRPRGWVRRNLDTITKDLNFLKYPKNGKDSGMLDLYVTIKLPDDLFIDTDKPKIGWYDHVAKEWKFDGIREKESVYHSESKCLTMKIWRMEPFAIVNPRALDFPYKTWSLTQSAEEKGSVDLVLSGSRFEAKLRVSAQGVTLISPKIAQFENVVASPGNLLLKLQECGINLLPTDDDADFCRKPLKLKELETKAHAELASVAGLMNLRASKYNGSQGEGTVLVKIREVGYRPKLNVKLEAAAGEDEGEEKSAEEIAKEKSVAERKELMAILTGETPEDKKLKEIDDDIEGWKTVCSTQGKWIAIDANRFNLRNKIYEPAEGCMSHLMLKDAALEVFPNTKDESEVPVLLQKNVERLLNLVRVLVFH